ncbi:MAG: hypothetical protein RLZZ136_380 [Pseudomonadota bacterium]|jgi:uncharacterized metal-binding protein YceD (DUF177 family)
MSEFSRMGDIRVITTAPIELVASADERKALARRFDLVAIDRLEAVVALERNGTIVTATGRLSAAIVQSCAVSGEDLPVTINEPLAFRFAPEGQPMTPDEEIELDEEACDEIPYSGTAFDIGEAVAQSLILAVDPYATGPHAEATRAAGILGEAASGPFAALAALKTKPND